MERGRNVTEFGALVGREPLTGCAPRVLVHASFTVGGRYDGIEHGGGCRSEGIVRWRDGHRCPFG